MSILASAKNKAASGSVKAAFTNEDGAIDLASIMVGIIVIGLIGGVIAATVFAVIPWAQDNAAKQQLDSVASAESAYIGLSTEGGVQQTFASAPTTGTNAGKIISGTETLFDGSSKGANLVVTASGTGNGAHYGAAVKSDSGKVFYIGDRKTQPTTVTDASSVTAAAGYGQNGNFTGKAPVAP
jgi:type II secretory pathway pseudopilin PulG